MRCYICQNQLHLFEKIRRSRFFVGAANQALEERYIWFRFRERSGIEKGKKMNLRIRTRGYKNQV